MSSPCPLPSSHAEAAAGSPAPYRRRRPEQTIAYQVVQQHLESWLAAHREANPHDDPIPSDVERDLRNYLDCGILARGCARARCTACGHEPQTGQRGETVLMLTPLEFLDRLALLIPPPRRHRHRYFGVLAPNSPWRPAVTARAGVAIETEGAASASGPSTGAAEEASTAHPARYLWTMLLARIYGIFALTCTHCGGEVRLIAFVTEVAPIREILEHIGEPTKPPRVHPPRAPPEHNDEPRGVDDEDFTQDHFDHEFDQTVSW